MKIPFKAVYALLDNFFARRSINEYIKNDISEEIFNGSLMFAKAVDDYNYLSSLVSYREQLENDYCLFIGRPTQLPIVLKKDEDLTIIEFATLYRQAGNIHKSYFDDIINSVGNNIQLTPDKIEEHRNHFTEWVNLFDTLPDLEYT